MSAERDTLKALILCTGNSARSILGEYLLREFGRGRLEVHSAGAKPTGKVNPPAIRVLRDEYGIDASDARSKSWDEFRDATFDYVITVCDNAKGVCPAWRGAENSPFVRSAITLMPVRQACSHARDDRPSCEHLFRRRNSLACARLCQTRARRV